MARSLNLRETRPQSCKESLMRMLKSLQREHIDIKHRDQCVDKIKSLAVQGNNLELAAAADADLVWQSLVYDMKSGTLKLLLNAAIDTLPTAANLKRWRKSPSDQCKLCQGRQTTAHCLNIGKVSLDTSRWTWRHNTILNYILEFIDTNTY